MPSPQTSALKSLHVLDINFAYLDSGPPPSSDYTTWVFIHGMGFNGAILEKLLPLAHAHNLRIVSVYRRGYPPSTGFTDVELSGIGPGKKIDDVEPFARARATEIATFLVNFVREQRIPEADPNAPNGGGIALIGWSLGSAYVLAVLAYLDTFPEDAQSTLRKYLHTALIHGEGSLSSSLRTNTYGYLADTGPTMLGIPNTPQDDDSSLLSETDDRIRFDGFFDWLTSHFTHKSVTSENLADLEFNIPNPDIPRSFHALPYTRRAAYTNIEPASRTGCDVKLIVCDLSAFAEITRRALFDRPRAEKSPRVRVRFMCGGTGGGVFIWTMWMFKKYVDNPPEVLYGRDAENARDTKIIIQTEGNHFVFWEDPEKAIQHYGATINM